MDKEILTTKEVAKLTTSTIRTIERKAREGYYPKSVCGKHGTTWLFNKTKLLEFIFT